MNYKEKLAAGFIIARRKAPYFDAALTGMIRIEVPGLSKQSGILGLAPTMGITRQNILLYEKEALERWDVDEIAAVLVHEVGHVLRDHAKRCHDFGGNQDLYNLAGDCAINDDLVLGGWKLPDEPMLPKRIPAKDGLTEEEYYALLEPKVTWVETICGSGAGKPFPNEPQLVEGEEGRTEAEIQILRHRCAEAMQKHRGYLPGDWKIWAEKILAPPKIRWQDKLARIARHAIQTRPGASTYTYRRPSRRQSACGYGPGRPILPGLLDHHPRVTIAIDTSGSMSQHDLGLALRECVGVLRATGGHITLIVIDAKIHEIKPVRTVQEAEKLLKGGGGTDFVPVFHHLETLRNPPEILIFMTDGCGPAPKTEPSFCKTIWLLIGNQLQHPCTWGEQIEVRN